MHVLKSHIRVPQIALSAASYRVISIVPTTIVATAELKTSNGVLTAIFTLVLRSEWA